MKTNKDDSIFLDKVIFPHQQILTAIQFYAQKLNTIYQKKTLVIITVMNGAVFFASYLANYLTNSNIEMDFISISSYQTNQQQKRQFHFHKKLKIKIANKDVLLLEDIIDSGTTIKKIHQFLTTLSPKSLRIASLILRQKSLTQLKKEFPLPIEYLLSLTSDHWVVGFGLDYGEKYRQLPDVYCLKWSKNNKPISTI